MPDEDPIKSPQNSEANEDQNTGEDTEEQRKMEEYKQRARYLIADLEHKLEEENVPVAICVLIDPVSGKPVLYSKGNSYQLARLAVDTARYYKNLLNEELEA